MCVLLLILLAPGAAAFNYVSAGGMVKRLSAVDLCDVIPGFQSRVRFVDP